MNGKRAKRLRVNVEGLPQGKLLELKHPPKMFVMWKPPHGFVKTLVPVEPTLRWSNDSRRRAYQLSKKEAR